MIRRRPAHRNSCVDAAWRMRQTLAMRTAASFLLALLMASAAVTARAADEEDTPVDMALVLVSDVSRSIDDSEFELQKAGYTAAFTSDVVLDAIKSGTHGAIAVAYVEFASDSQVRTVLDFAIVHDAASAHALADRLAAAPRSFSGRTAIGAGIDAAMRVLAASPFPGARQVIDVCGDGTSNSGPDVNAERDAAVAAGMTVNGLTIINDHPASFMHAHVQPPGGLTSYYRDHVIGGPASFVLEVHDFASFGKAMTLKLVDEIAALPPSAPGRRG
jgi:hypothetical protein